MSDRVDHIAGHTWHGRKGAIDNAFRYSIDYVLLNAEGTPDAPRLFGRNRAALAGIRDTDHGGAPGQGRGVVWVREVLAQRQIPAPARIELLAQPRILGHVFNPVSFWLCRAADSTLRSVIAEVTNTYGDRHSYLVHRPDHGPITATDRLRAQKVFHVSPFQRIEGQYEFRFDLREDRIGIWIDMQGHGDGVLATLVGKRTALSNRGLLAAMLRRPLGSRRVLALIHWQAIKLWWKGARFHNRPAPPVDDVSR
jgi:hypothetical protein